VTAPEKFMSARKRPPQVPEKARSPDPSPFSLCDGGLSLAVRVVVPGASRSSVDGVVADAAGRPMLRVRVAAPAVEGAANRALTGFIAERLGVRKSAVTIVSGETARSKILRIEGGHAELSALLSGFCARIEGGPPES
jgi:uncharacterized protein